MSRLLRALGLGGGGSEQGGRERSATRFDTPKVRRLRETMRWRGYDLSDYSDEQIAAVSARFPNDISEDGETTEDGRRALAEALERGDFAAPVPTAEPPRPRDEPAPRPAASAPSPQPPPSPPSARRAGTGQSTFSERMLHVFGIHSWRRLDGDDGVSLRCAGCGQLRSAPTPVEPPPPPLREDEPPSPIAPPRSTVEPPPEAERPPSAPDPITPFEIPGRQTGERPSGPRQQRPESPWQFFLGLPWWSKLIAIFILVQVVGFIVQRIGGG